VNVYESERLRSFTYDEIVARDKANLDITWLTCRPTSAGVPEHGLLEPIDPGSQVVVTRTTLLDPLADQRRRLHAPLGGLISHPVEQGLW